MIRFKNTKGFTVMEVLMVILILTIAGLGGWYVYSQNSNKNSDISKETQNSTASETVDDYNDWKTFEDKKEGVTFRYPSNWNLEVDEGEDLSDGLIQVSLTSPSSKTAINYSNHILGLGGGTCPEDYACPTINILNIENVTGTKGKFKFIERINSWEEDDRYIVDFGLLDTDEANKYKEGSTKGNSFYILANFSNEGGSFKSLHDQNELFTFKTYAEAEAYLDSDEADTAKQIIKSIQLK